MQIPIFKKGCVGNEFGMSVLLPYVINEVPRNLDQRLNYSNKITMNFFTNTLDPMIALPLIAVLGIFLFLLVGAWTDQKVFTMETSQK